MSKRSGHGSSLEGLAVHLLHRAGQVADEIFSREVNSLTPRQFAVLACVGEREGLSQTDIVEQTGVDRSTIAQLVRRMAKKGLLHRRRSKQDARAYKVRLTDSGREALKSAGPGALRAHTAVLARLSGEQRKGLMKALKVIGSS